MNGLTDDGQGTPADAILELWEQYKVSSDLRLRDRLVFALSPIVTCVVDRWREQIPAARDDDDFVVCGLEALIDAMDSYDPVDEMTLEQFAWSRVSAELRSRARRDRAAIYGPLAAVAGVGV